MPIMRNRPLASAGPIALDGLDLKLESAEWNDRGLNLCVSMPDRETGAWGSASYHSTFVRPPSDETELACFIVAACAELLAHEVAERILVRGRRVLDPHQSNVPMLSRLADVLNRGKAPSPVKG